MMVIAMLIFSVSVAAERSNSSDGDVNDNSSENLDDDSIDEEIDNEEIDDDSGNSVETGKNRNDTMNELRLQKKGQKESIKDQRKEQREEMKEQVREFRNGTLTRMNFTALRKQAGQFYKELSDEEKDKIKALGKIEMTRFMQMNNTELRERLGNIELKNITVREILQKRKINTERIKESLQSYKHARERYEEFINKSKESKIQFDETRDEYRACVKDQDNCTVLNSELLNQSKMYLLNTVGSVETYLLQVKEKIVSNDDIDEASAAALQENIDTLLSKLDELKIDINEATTKEELRQVSQDLKRLVQNIKERTQFHIAKLIHAQVGEILSRSTLLESKMEQLLERMNNNNITVDDLQEKVDAFSTLIAQAKESYQEATNLFNQAWELRSNEGQTEEVQALLNQSKEKARIAHGYLKEANQILREIVSLAKQKGTENSELSIEDDEEVTVVA